MWTDTVVTGNKIDWRSVTRQRAIMRNFKRTRLGHGNCRRISNTFIHNSQLTIENLYKMELPMQKANQFFLKKNSKILNGKSFLRARVQTTIIRINQQFF